MLVWAFTPHHDVTEHAGAHLKCLYVKAGSTWDKQKEMIALSLSQSQDIIAVSESQWEESSDGVLWRSQAPQGEVGGAGKQEGVCCI